MDINVLIGICGLLIGVISIVITQLSKEKKKLKQREDDGLYYEGDDTAHPYCPDCYEIKRKNVLLKKTENSYICPKCKNSYVRPAVSISVVPYPGPRFRI